MFLKKFAEKSLLLWSLVLMLISMTAVAQSEYRFIRRGNKAFEKGDFSKAEVDYRKALERNNRSDIGQFNLGGAVYNLNNFDEAAVIFDQLARQKINDETKAKTFHNLGNALVQMGKYAEAIEAYKNALRLNPSDMDTRYNLLYAMQMLQKQQNEQKNQQNQNQDQNQNQQNQSQNQQEQSEKQQSGDQQAENQQSQSKKEGEPLNKQITKEDAERMLQALQNRERKILEKKKLEELKSAGRRRAEKDW